MKGTPLPLAVPSGCPDISVRTWFCYSRPDVFPSDVAPNLSAPYSVAFDVSSSIADSENLTGLGLTTRTRCFAFVTRSKKDQGAVPGSLLLLSSYAWQGWRGIPTPHHTVILSGVPWVSPNERMRTQKMLHHPTWTQGLIFRISDASLYISDTSFLTVSLAHSIYSRKFKTYWSVICLYLFTPFFSPLAIPGPSFRLLVLLFYTNFSNLFHLYLRIRRCPGHFQSLLFRIQSQCTTNLWMLTYAS